MFVLLPARKPAAVAASRLKSKTQTKKITEKASVKGEESGSESYHTKRRRVEQKEKAISLHVPDAASTDEHRLKQRQKQIDYGKNTNGYDNYMRQVPVNQRERYHMRTPDKHRRQSKRSWAFAVRRWRQYLHKYDEKPQGQENALAPSSPPSSQSLNDSKDNHDEEPPTEAAALPSIFDGFDDNGNEEEEVADEDDLL